jgi:hypothetical protein
MRCYCIGLFLACLLTGGLAAQRTGGGHDPWDAVKALDAGALVEVLPRNQAGPDECRVVSVDGAALTCFTERGSSSGARLVFPRDGLRRVWVVEQAPERHVGRWIAIVVGAGLIAAAAAGSGVLGGVIVGAGVVIAAAVIWSDRPFPSPPRPPRMRRRLIYKGVTP